MRGRRIGDGPIDPKYHKQMNDLARFVDGYFNGDAGERTTGFCLLVFPFGDHGRCNYISNAELADMIVLFKEQLARMEGRLVEQQKATKH